MKRTSLASAIVGASLLIGCAGRPPQPVAVVHPVDQYMTCHAIAAETYANAAKLSQLSVEEGNKRTQNIAMGVVGAVLFWPALFAMDFQDAAGTEAASINVRNQYLTTMAVQRRC